MSGLRVMERPPLRLDIDVRTPNRRHQRLARDERRPEHRYSGLSLSSISPGGFEGCGFTLPRDPDRAHPDLAPLSQVTVHGAGGEIAWQGRLEATPRTSGQEAAISPAAVGNQAALDDDKSAREIYRDIDLAKWEGNSAAQKLFRLSIDQSTEDPAGATPDQVSGAPAFQTQLTGPWSRFTICEAWYRSPVPIGVLHCGWTRGASVGATDPNLVWDVILHDFDAESAGGTFQESGSLRAAGPGTVTLAATTTTRKAVAVRMYYTVAAGADGVIYPIFWTPAVYGRHGLPKRGTEPRAGFYASDIIAHAVRKYTGLSVRDENIVPTTFIIEQAAFHDPTTASEIVSQANRFDRADWAVWEHNEFHYHPRGQRGRVWRARVGEAKLEETGQDAARVWNGVVVQFADVDGSTKMVGPPGSGADTETVALLDTDPENPANQLGQNRWELLPSIGVATTAGATEVGRRWIEEQKLLDSSGRASIVGYATDDKGIVRPAWQVRAGDRIVFTDAADTRERRIVKAAYDHDSKTCSIDLDAPPSGHEELLARLAASVESLGIG